MQSDETTRAILPERYQVALDDAVQHIHDQFRPIGIVVSGTIIRGTPDSASDLDIVAVHEEPWRQRVQRFFAGVPADIFVNPPAEIRRAFTREAVAYRPVLVHMIATGITVHDPTGVVKSLMDEAASTLALVPQLSDLELNQRRYVIATGFEGAEDIATRDAERATVMIIDAVMQAARLVFLKAGRWLPREKDLLSELDMLKPSLASQCREIVRAGSIDEQLALARPFLHEIVGATGFFEWESDQQPVPH